MKSAGLKLRDWFRAFSSKAGNLPLRILSSLILGPLVLWIVYRGGTVYDVAVAALALVALYEWLLLVDPQAGRHLNRLNSPNIFIGMLIILALGIIVSIKSALIATALLTVALYLLSFPAGRNRALWIAASLPYVAGCALALIYLRQLEPFGAVIMLYLLVVVWGTDIGAYFTGRTIGGPKLAPVISPNKTWSGLCGGMALAGMVGFMVATHYSLPHAGYSLPHAGAAGLLAMVMAVVAQGGDLFESVVKRQSGVKESGHMIPGHGGVLDRIDGLIFAAIFLAVLHKTAHSLMPG